MRTTLARVGHVALGIVYVVIGIVAARVAFLGARDRLAGMPGALRVLLDQRHGLALLAAVAVGLTAYALWRASEVFNPRRPFLARLEHGISFIGYAALAVSSVRLVFRAAGRPADVRRAESPGFSPSRGAAPSCGSSQSSSWREARSRSSRGSPAGCARSSSLTGRCGGSAAS